jgi:hypothetical protein
MKGQYMPRMTKKRTIALATLGLAGLMSIGIVAAQADTRADSSTPVPSPTSSVSVDGSDGISLDDNTAHDNTAHDNSVAAPSTHDVTDDESAAVDDGHDNEGRNSHAATPAIPATPATNDDSGHHAETPATPAVPAAHEVNDEHDGDSVDGGHSGSGH